MIDLGGKLPVPSIGLGCMRIAGMEKTAIASHIRAAMELGVNFFDHADLYGKGENESKFSEALNMTPSLRGKMILQTKCGIRPGVCYDLSKKYILDKVDESLKHLRTDFIDIFLLHRPDALWEPEEIAEAFQILKGNGKVRYFGVSNQNAHQIALLRRYLGEETVLCNQLQLSITNCSMIDIGINANTSKPDAIDRDGGVLDYCRLHNITIQTWSPFQYGMFEGTFIGDDKYPALNQKLDELAAQYNVTPSAIAVAWVLRHPARMQVLVGTTNSVRLGEICKALEFRLTREEWYALYMAAGKTLP